MAAININHNEGSITIDDDKVLQITKNGAVKIGVGTYLDEIDSSEADSAKSEYTGALRYNPETKLLEYCDGTAWKAFAYDIDQTPGIIWAITF